MKTNISELKKIPIDKWAKIWCELTHWKMPSELTHIKPSYWVDNPSSELEYRTNMVFSTVLMMEIKDVIGLKSCLRQHNIDRMTDEEFEEFWDDRHNV